MNLADIEISERELIRRVLNNMQSTYRRRSQTIPRWACVVELFAVGSTVAKDLCVEFHLDPEEYI